MLYVRIEAAKKNLMVVPGLAPVFYEILGVSEQARYC